ncbi:MAG: trypsin-like peptidase domain-containing protein [Thermoguttaceae bacterium]|nr:trypsin-like peptidase domain-containing protein [Thermoguttaceae bacterium]
MFVTYKNAIHPNVSQFVKSVTSGTLSAPPDSMFGSSGTAGTIKGKKNVPGASSPQPKAPKPPRQSLFALGPSTGAQGYDPLEYQRRKEFLAKYSYDNKIGQTGGIGNKETGDFGNKETGDFGIKKAVQNAYKSVVLVGNIESLPAHSSQEPDYLEPSYGVLVRAPREGFYFVLSAFHVVEENPSTDGIYICFPDGSVVTPIEMVQKPEKEGDIVVLSIAAKDVPKDAVPAKLRDNADMKSPDVAAFAPPTGDGLEDPTLYRRSNSFMTGKLAKKGGTGDFMFKAPIKGGCSGGPIVDKDGAVIGLIQSRHKDDERDARGIPIYDAILLADKNLERLTPPAVVKNEQVVLKNASYSSR